MHDTGSKVDGFGSLPLNLSSVPFTGRFVPGCRQKRRYVRQDESGNRTVRTQSDQAVEGLYSPLDHPHQS